jgi:hypothetical protein
MRNNTLVIGTLALALTLSSSVQAQLGGIGKKKDAPSTAAKGGEAEVSGAEFLKKLTPGAIKFTQAYGKYYEALGDAGNAAKMQALAEQLETGGTITKDQQKMLDGGLKGVKEAAKQGDLANEEAKAKWKEGNKLYRLGLAEWVTISTSVALVIKNNPTAVASQPELGMAAGLCVKGLKDLTGYLEIAAAKVGEQKEMDKAAK